MTNKEAIKILPDMKGAGDDWDKAIDLAIEALKRETSGDAISRQAAIDALAKHEKSNGHNYTLFVDIVSECAEIIRDLPSVQPTHTNTPNTLKSLDCVDRQAVKEMMCVKHCTAYPTCQQKYGCYKTHDLELLPPVQPEPH